MQQLNTGPLAAARYTHMNRDTQDKALTTSMSVFPVQLSQRFWNAHAMINMAVWLRKEQPSLASSIRSRLGVEGVKDPAHRIAEVRVVIGSPRAELQGESALIVNTETSHALGISLRIPKGKLWR